MTASRHGLLPAALLLAGAAALAGCGGEPSAAGTNAPSSGASSDAASGSGASQGGPTTDAPDSAATDTTGIPAEGGFAWKAKTLKDAGKSVDVSKVDASMTVQKSDVAWYDGVNRCMAKVDLKGDQATVSGTGCTKMGVDGQRDEARDKLSDTMAKIMAEGSPFTLKKTDAAITVSRGDATVTFAR